MQIQGIFPRNIEDIEVELLRLGVPAGELPALSARAMFHVIRISGANRAAATKLREEMAAAGGDTAMPLSAYGEESAGGVSVLLMGNRVSFGIFLAAISAASPELGALADKINSILSRVEGAEQLQPIMWPDGPMNFGARTYIMGVINCTPDSFYDGGMNFMLKDALASARRMIADGADILDVGGESTRPGSLPVNADEEIARTVPFIKEIKREFPSAKISIDTVKARVAAAAIEAGASMINDISGLCADPDMLRVAAESALPVCIMHIKGTPADMQSNPEYPDDVCYEINRFFRERLRSAVEAGVRESQIVIDPGIGFGKTVEHNLEILRRLAEFRSHGRPLLVGASRKSFIGKTLNLEPEERLEGSLAAAALSVTGGADFVRVHDVKETVRAVRLADAVARKGRMLEKKVD